MLFFTIITGRYLLVSGLFYGIFYLWQPAKWKERKLSRKPYPAGQLKKEIKWSTLSSFIFALAAALAWWLWQSGNTLVYTDITRYGWWYLPVSLLLSMFIQETYYYWLHRLMHRKAIFSIVHKVHHDSITTSPFTAFSFHPIESVIQAIVLLVIPMVLPLHPLVILTQLTLMSLTSVINHLNIDIFPDSGAKKAMSKCMIGATHHSLHHKKHQKNFGLYFTFWDKLLHTEYTPPAAAKVHSPAKEKMNA
ncbi:MAG TPA: sterol desaturase family protein [Chitinophagaceae bacterium]|nr:sterol desaturase family protein [Chitinophagaceae bacterium]